MGGASFPSSMQSEREPPNPDAGSLDFGLHVQTPNGLVYAGGMTAAELAALTNPADAAPQGGAAPEAAASEPPPVRKSDRNKQPTVLYKPTLEGPRAWVDEAMAFIEGHTASPPKTNPPHPGTPPKVKPLRQKMQAKIIEQPTEAAAPVPAQAPAPTEAVAAKKRKGSLVVSEPATGGQQGEKSKKSKKYVRPHPWVPFSQRKEGKVWHTPPGSPGLVSKPGSPDLDPPPPAASPRANGKAAWSPPNDLCQEMLDGEDAVDAVNDVIGQELLASIGGAGGSGAGSCPSGNWQGKKAHGKAPAKPAPRLDVSTAKLSAPAGGIKDKAKYVAHEKSMLVVEGAKKIADVGCSSFYKKPYGERKLAAGKLKSTIRRFKFVKYALRFAKKFSQCKDKKHAREQNAEKLQDMKERAAKLQGDKRRFKGTHRFGPAARKFARHNWKHDREIMAQNLAYGGVEGVTCDAHKEMLSDYHRLVKKYEFQVIAEAPTSAEEDEDSE